MDTREVSHPLFARAYTRFSQSMEKEIGPYRAELLDGLTGEVLEVGAGNGMNLIHYPPEVERVIALEPEPYLRARAEEAARSAVPLIEIVDGNAIALPFEDQSFDAVVFCLVLCSIEDQQSALAEARRVLRPGGAVRFLEHVRSSRPAKARIQRFLDRGLWPSIAGGCHCSRDTVRAIDAAGFRIEAMRGMPIGVAWGHANPHVLGSARAE